MATGEDKSLGVMITKPEAAKFLGVSSRAINRYCAEGRLRVTHLTLANGGDGPAMFDPADLEAFRNAPREPVRRDSQALVKPVKASEGDLPAVFQGFVEAQVKVARVALIQAKLTLTLAEATTLAGVPRVLIREAIREGRLKAAIRGRGWNIKRADLEAWIEGL